MKKPTEKELQLGFALLQEINALEDAGGIIWVTDTPERKKRYDAMEAARFKLAEDIYEVAKEEAA